MVMRAGARKFALTSHVVSSVGALGAVAAFLALAVAGLTGQDSVTARAAYPAMELIASFVILPLVFASLATGLVQSLGTSWGLIRHYWILAKLVLSIVVIVVLLLQMDLIGHVSLLAAEMAPAELDSELRASLVLHAAGGLIVLLTAATLSVYKPRGMTRYGWRKQQEERGVVRNSTASSR